MSLLKLPVTGPSRVQKALSGLATLQSEFKQGIQEVESQITANCKIQDELQAENESLSESVALASEALNNVQAILPNSLVKD